MKQNSFLITSSSDNKQFYLEHMVYLPNRGGTPFGYNASITPFGSRGAALISKALLESSFDYQQQLDNKLMTYVVDGRIILASDIEQATKLANQDTLYPITETVREIERGEYIVGYGFIT